MKKIICALSMLAALNTSSSFAQQEKAGNAQQEARIKTEEMAKELKLSDEQKSAVMEINRHQAIQNRNSKLTDKQRREIEKSCEVKYKTVLNEEQFKKYKVAQLREKEKEKALKKANADIKK